MKSPFRSAALAAPLLMLSSCGLTGDSSCTEKPGVVCVWAGTGELGFNGDHKPLRQSRMYWPVDVEFAPDGTPWVLDWNNHYIRRVQEGTFETVIGTFIGDGPPDQSDLTAEGAIALEVSLNHPTDIQFAPDGSLIFAAWHNHKIRKLNLQTGRVTVISGRGAGFAGDGADPSQALYSQPKSIVVDKDGAIFILDQRNFRVRKISAGPTPVVSTVVGVGTPGFSGDGGEPLKAQLRFEAGGNPEPSGALALAADGTLFIADSRNHRIRKVDFAQGVISTIAGTGEAGAAGDGGPAVSAQLNDPRDIELGPDGRLYIADTENHRIRVVDLQTGMIDTVVGTGTQGENGEGLPARELQLNRPFGIAFDPNGNLYISDTFNSRILKVTR